MKSFRHGSRLARWNPTSIGGKQSTANKKQGDVKISYWCKKIYETGPLSTMCFYLMRWHSRLAIFFGYTCLLLVTLIFLLCGGYFDNSNSSQVMTTSNHRENFTTITTDETTPMNDATPIGTNKEIEFYQELSHEERSLLNREKHDSVDVDDNDDNEIDGNGKIVVFNEY